MAKQAALPLDVCMARACGALSQALMYEINKDPMTPSEVMAFLDQLDAFMRFMNGNKHLPWFKTYVYTKSVFFDGSDFL